MKYLIMISFLIAASILIYSVFQINSLAKDNNATNFIQLFKITDLKAKLKLKKILALIFLAFLQFFFMMIFMVVRQMN
ncbi:hypothetical protein [uncultured Croceitalea sp.]|uniref:hypothetical protein n=1 Tax=uncultured Croceitalea sp. TaxID=1798908 RepID=UPI00374EAA73